MGASSWRCPHGCASVVLAGALYVGGAVATELPLGAYNVSGEFAMVKAAVASKMIDERRAVLEILTSMRRAGADFILTYHALDAARWLG